MEKKIPRSIPFCVVDRPFVVWSDDPNADVRAFLGGIDAEFYRRSAALLMGGESEEDDEADGSDTDDQERRDVSSLARLLWHHGSETLVMLLGSYLQAPGAVQGYFSKCRTEDITELATLLYEERLPAYHRSSGEVQFSMITLLNGIHLHAGWENKEETIEAYSHILVEILGSLIRPEVRFEYNSIKHGLRARHGPFSLSFGIEQSPGVLKAGEAMRELGRSRDSSYFDVPHPLNGASKNDSKTNFFLKKATVAWSLERVLCDLQILSFLIRNAVSALKIVAGVEATTCRFVRPAEATWWDAYKGFRVGPVITATLGREFDATGKKLPTAEAVRNSYTSNKWSH
jgi:hypothetical protein